ncbi:MAG TPA: hypothetical protein ENI17_10180 [Pseudomonas xinjiangensis]|uniref:Lipoprotein n=2 Tax=root TaxID=1 RepID=A0A7V1FS35_9GAMM|nr:hypothetical protein [Halopseudomonas xinjiangensis]HEC47984.1 hypothetical protein [Halopseudomonas xinjiangensis]
MRQLSSPWLLWIAASLVLSACGTQPPTDGPYIRTERQLVSHGIHMNAGDSVVLNLPQRTIRFTEQSLYSVSEYDRQDVLLNQRESFHSIPWATKPVEVIAGQSHTVLHTDADGMLRLNLLDDEFIGLDYENLRVIQLVAHAEPASRSEVNLLISRELRPKLHEAIALIYDDLEDDNVDQWAYRVQRLAELGLAEESNQLENMLILLTTADPELQGDFVQALGPEKER